MLSDFSHFPLLQSLPSSPTSHVPMAPSSGTIFQGGWGGWLWFLLFFFRGGGFSDFFVSFFWGG